MAKIQNHVENTIDNLRDSAGDVHEINAAYLDGKGAEEYVTQATLSIISSQVDTNEKNIASLTQSVMTLEDTSKKTEARLGEIDQSILSLTEKTDKIADDVEHIPRIYTGETIREGQRTEDFFILEETRG